MNKNKKKRISYFEHKGKYLVMKEDGTSLILSSKEELNSYAKENDYQIIN